MKKVLRFTLMAALAILISLPSCKKSDDPKPEDLIVGRWKITYAKIDGYKEEELEDEVWSFKDNGKFTGCLEEEDEEIDCNWILNGNELVLKGGDLEYSEPGYSVEAVITLDIEKLDNKELIVSGKAKVEYYEEGYGSETESIKVSYELMKK